ncbi:hypothetical protein HBH53_264440 [Parastagonospora nodorum]|nr:hypothetical protein HBH53_264440 [Parastagonospora nodorum]
MLKPMRTHFRSACVKRCTDAIRHLSPAAITLGVALNTLEAFSLGILIFPSDDRHGVFAGLQTQAMSLFIMSTVISQAVLTMGGSSVPPALSSMLAEALPFLRSIATTIQNNLGSGHPDVLPTTLAAFALSSVALGTVFLLLAALRIGSLVSFFPETVMSGVIGAVGVSLCILGLEIPFPASSPHLNLAALFHRDHIPLLAASVLPALCLSITVRLEILVVGATSWTKHPLYVPLFCIGTAMTFWIVVAASSNTDTTTLWHQGWLFATTIELSTSSAPWDYWSLFDMERIQWSELLSVSKDLATLVAIGALSLPIFGMATVAKVDVSDHSMNHEFIGHGLANVIAGLGGTLPALMIYSNTLFFHRAGGNRGEACIVTLLMLGVFFASSYILPYVPTVTASTLTVFIGMELLIDSLWQSSSSLIWDEWITVAATTLACSIMGFAPGMGVGLALVVGFQFLRTAIQTVNCIHAQSLDFGLTTTETSHNTRLHTGQKSRSASFASTGRGDDLQDTV